MSKIIVITGPTGAGKSTVAKLLCKKFPKCVRLDIDRVKHFVESGFIYDESEQGVAQWDLCANNVAMLTKNFFNEGYNVVVEGVIDGWEIIFDAVNVEKKFLLFPDKEVAKKRDKMRDEFFQQGDNDVERHFRELFNKDIFDGFIKIDSTDQTAEETAEKIFQEL